MPWRCLRQAPGHRPGSRPAPARQGIEPPLQRLVRLAAEHPGVHGFVHHATADNGVVEQARALTRELLQGRDISQQCRELCRRHGVPEPLLRARLWAVASLFPGYSAADVGPYEILGVDPTADPETIKSAFRKLCRESHPDLNPNDPEAATRFQKIKSAYDMVSEPAGRSLLSRPSGACVWEESPAEESRPTAWGRMRHLAPLAMVVAVLILTVGVADLFVRRPRTSSLPRDASVKTQTANTPDEAELGHKEPLTLGTARNRSAEIVCRGSSGTPRPDTSEASRPEGGFRQRHNLRTEFGLGASGDRAYPRNGGGRRHEATQRRPEFFHRPEAGL